jgi:hypothetical protein
MPKTGVSKSMERLKRAETSALGDSDEESEGEESTAGEGVESRLQKELRL